MKRFSGAPKLSGALIRVLDQMVEQKSIIANAVTEYLEANPDIRQNPEVSGDVRDFLEMVPIEPGWSQQQVKEATASYLSRYYDMEHPEERANLLDQFYNRTEALDVGTLDLSCLHEQEDGPRVDDQNQQRELTNSEKDLLKLLQHQRGAQTRDKKLAENPDYASRRFTSTDHPFWDAELAQQLTTINCGRYLSVLALVANGLGQAWNHAPWLAEGFADEISNGDILAGEMDMAVGVAQARVAVDHGKEPEPLLLHVPAGAAKPGNQDLVFRSFFGPIAEQAERMGMNPMEYIYINGLPLTEAFEGTDKERQDKLVAALLTGKHKVDVLLPVQGKGNQSLSQVKLLRVKPDLRALDQEYREANYSWIHRTLFDWGPFKIQTPADLAEAAWAKDTAYQSRHQEIAQKMLPKVEQQAKRMRSLKMFAWHKGAKSKAHRDALAKATSERLELQQKLQAATQNIREMNSRISELQWQQTQVAGLLELQGKIGRREASMEQRTLTFPEVEGLLGAAPAGVSTELGLQIMRAQQTALYWTGLYGSIEGNGINNRLFRQLEDGGVAADLVQQLKAMQPQEITDYIAAQSKEKCRDLFALCHRALAETSYNIKPEAVAETAEKIHALEELQQAGRQERQALKAQELLQEKIGLLASAYVNDTKAVHSDSQMKGLTDAVANVELTRAPYEADQAALDRLAAAILHNEDILHKQANWKAGIEITDMALDHQAGISQRVQECETDDLLRGLVAEEMRIIGGFKETITAGLDTAVQERYREQCLELQNYGQGTQGEMSPEQVGSKLREVWMVVRQGVPTSPDYPEFQQLRIEVAPDSIGGPEALLQQQLMQAEESLKLAQIDAERPLQRLACAELPRLGMDTLEKIYGSVYDHSGINHLRGLEEQAKLADLDPSKDRVEQMQRLVAGAIVDRTSLKSSLTEQQREQTVEEIMKRPQFKEAVGNTPESISQAMKDSRLAHKVFAEPEAGAVRPQAPEAARVDMQKQDAPQMEAPKQGPGL